MTTRALITALLIAIASIAANAQNIVTTYDDGDMLTAQVTIFGVKEKQAMAQAESILRYALFFRGLPDSQTCKNPLVGTDEQVAAKHPEYFKQMFEQDRFASFLPSSEFLSYTKKNKISVIQFTVNVKALRLDLEQQGVKRRFGF
ncbi:MAG: hypothetical protein NC210_03865 [[Clostridium] fimetarium]|nr:hypothetical protein [Alistipes timonensis]MCM1405541.1 hypothetical protein [[Clostridium] fimetarium]